MAQNAKFVAYSYNVNIDRCKLKLYRYGKARCLSRPEGGEGMQIEIFSSLTLELEGAELFFEGERRHPSKNRGAAFAPSPCPHGSAAHGICHN